MAKGRKNPAKGNDASTGKTSPSPAPSTDEDPLLTVPAAALPGASLPPRPVLPIDVDLNGRSLKNHPLSGIEYSQWKTIVRKYGRLFDWGRYLRRILFLSLMAIINSFFALFEAMFHDTIARTRSLHQEPVFILGHPRTGTTHVFNLMALDDRFIFANTLMVGFPNTFFVMERFRRFLNPILSPRRPMDNMALTWDLPQEDELATNVLTGGLSPYMPICLMRDRRRFEKYYTFEGAPESEAKSWIKAFILFLRKVTLRRCTAQGKPKPLLIKSPVHTARVKLLLQMFPKAKFIYVHRHPYEVLQSAAVLAERYYGYCSLQRPSQKDVSDFIFEQYELLWNTYISDRGLIPRGNLVEIGFADLDARPLETMERIYRRFGWAARFPEVKPRLAEYCLTLTDFKKNDHGKLTPEQAAYVAAAWRGTFEEYGYSAKKHPLLPDGALGLVTAAIAAAAPQGGEGAGKGKKGKAGRKGPSGAGTSTEPESGVEAEKEAAAKKSASASQPLSDESGAESGGGRSGTEGPGESARSSSGGEGDEEGTESTVTPGKGAEGAKAGGGVGRFASAGGTTGGSEGEWAGEEGGEGWKEANTARRRKR